MVEVIGRIKKVYENKSKKTGKPFYKIVISRDTDGTEVEAVSFSPVGYPEGSGVIAKLTPSGEYNGKEQFKIDAIKLLGASSTPTTKPPANPQAATAPDWDAKERRMVRMNCLSHATELVKDAQTFTEAKDLDKNTEEVIRIAGKLEGFVYGK